LVSHQNISFNNEKLLRGDARKAQSAMRHAPSPWLPEAKIFFNF
jgi:hypothetical protein